MDQPPTDPSIAIRAILAQAITHSTHSWEYGVTFHALLEQHTPHLSLFFPKSNPNPFPSSSNDLPIPSSPTTIPALAYITPHISTTTPTLYPLDEIGAADLCSLGIAALLLGQSFPKYLEAARRQIEHVLHHAPRLTNGAISHRNDAEEAWADFVFMVPPFFACAAVAFEDVEMLREGVRQCKLYHALLADVDPTSPTVGLWRHIAGLAHEDRGYWVTGCGWVAAGLVRVLAVLVHLPASFPFPEEEKEEAKTILLGYIADLITGAIRTDDGGDGTGLLRNYLTDPTYFPDAAGTALLASVVVRLAVLMPDDFDKEGLAVKWAEEKRQAVLGCVDSSSGVVGSACKSTDHKSKAPLAKGEVNPEAQAFVALLECAWRDWLQWRGREV